MRAFLLAVLVVGASLVGAVPASANSVDDRAPSEFDRATSEFDRTPPELPEQWRHTYGGEGNDMFSDLVRTDDGGYLVVGWKGGDDLDGWVVKVDGAGEKQWEKTFGTDGTDRFWGVATTDEGYLLAGRTDTENGPNGWILELDAEGEVQRERTPDTGAFYAVERDDTNFLLAGWTRGDSGVEGWATKLDANGTELWSNAYPAPDGYKKSYLRAVVPTDDGYYLAGKIEGDSDDMVAMKIDADGTQQWSATAGGAERDDVWAAAPADTGFVVAGETESGSDGPRDGWLVKFSADGDKEWEQTPGGSGVDWLDSAMQTDDGFVFTGSSTTGTIGGADGYVLATDADGETRWESYYGTDSWDKPWPHIRGHDGGYVLAGASSGDGAAGKDGWILQIGEGGDAATSDETTESTTVESETTRDGVNDSASDTTENDALAADTETAAEEGSAASEVPGFGVVTALLALLAAALLARR
ncbi:PGF-CTERM sorting domain-containing protein [Halorussus halophilus]|uniref:PGF-CTERM sorting domain-containing protein n=1 Tax=Halorussus halophilus TaxID=2650975 RepID=UPI0013016F57|nr:PGF-CTERM sorting domain-containing protein [Halorussus halophilus]